MATKKVEQPILNTDTETTPSSKSKTITKSRRRTSLDEFAAVNNLRPEVKAGLKAWLKGDNFHFDEDWKALFKKYQSR